jgi:serine/threonine protein kinase/tetratricopeptide (TPR) repeat protein
MNDTSNRSVELFTQALELPAGAREAFLEKACGADERLQSRVEALLKANDQAEGFLEPSFRRPERSLGGLVGEEPGDRIGRYKLLEQIGEGGCGVVFMAEQEEPVRRRVALKIIKPGMDSKSVIARFEAERQALALMDHPNIAKVFDAGATESGRPFFVMELVRGVKITDYCDRNSLTTEERLKLFIQVCHAVQHAHQKGIIHRDIKPSNILVTNTLEGEPLPVVIDFGVAKATTNQRLTDKTLFTAFEMLIGTPAYMSPEQAALTSVDVDTQSDIYSLGVLLYELLTGFTPFDTGELLKAGLDEIRRVIREQEPARPSTRLSKMTTADLTTVAQHRNAEPPRLVRTITGDLDWIVMKALEKDRSRRYETANGFALDVQRVLANEPISARPPSSLYRFQKIVLRNKFLFAAIGLIAGLLVVSLIVIWASLGRERRAHREADRDKQKAQSEAAKSQQVTQFMDDMLQGVGPSVALGRDTTILREILEKAVIRISTKLTNQPAVEAELRTRIGNIYGELALFDKAEAMHRAALAIYMNLYGMEHKDTAATLNNVAVVLRQKGKFPEAEAAFRKALEVRRRLFGNEHIDVATSLNDLSRVLLEQEKVAEAELLSRDSLAIRRKLLGEENLDVADSFDSLEIILREQGKRAEAETMARKVLSMRRKLLGEAHPLVAESLINLSSTLMSLEEVESCYRQALAIQSQLVGEDHLNVAVGLSDIAFLLRRRHNFIEAEKMLRHAISVEERFLPKEHPQYVITLRKLGLTLESAGKLAEAEVTDREVLTLARKVYRQGDYLVSAALFSLNEVLMTEKKYDEVEQILVEILTPDFITDPQSARCLAVRADYLARRGRWKEAAADMELAITYRPTSYKYYHMLAPLFAMSNNQNDYEQLCQKILKEFGKTKESYVADAMAKDCLLLPWPIADWEVVNRLADTAVSEPDQPGIRYFEGCKGLCDFRQGDLNSAVQLAQKSLVDAPLDLEGMSCAVLAMAHFHQKQTDQALAALTRGTQAISKLPRRGAEDLGASWQSWIFAQLLMDEAATLIHGASKIESPSKP